MFFDLILIIALTVIAVIMFRTVSSAKKGKIVAISTIKSISVAGIITSVIIFIFSLIPLVGIIFEDSYYRLSQILAFLKFFLPGLSMLAASILYKKSVKDMKLAKTGALVAIGSAVLALAMAYITSSGIIYILIN